MYDNEIKTVSAWCRYLRPYITWSDSISTISNEAIDAIQPHPHVKRSKRGRIENLLDRPIPNTMRNAATGNSVMVASHCAATPIMKASAVVPNPSWAAMSS